MKKLYVINILTITILASFNALYSQEKVIEGLILDSLKNPIQYANVGIINKPIGTVSNINGKFTLTVDGSLFSDTFRISSLGFKSKEFVIKDFLKKPKVNILLESYAIKLDEVTITSNNLKPNIKGVKRTKTESQVFFASPEIKNRNLGSQIGRKFSIGKNKSSLLKEFKFYVKNNDFKKVKFRVNIFTIKDNIPLNRINTTDVIVELEEDITGWVKVNLSDYNITVKEDVIITVEWVEASKEGNILSLPILLPSLKSTHYYKQSAQIKWRKYKMISSAMELTYKQ
jgi:hypothetical protein